MQDPEHCSSCGAVLEEAWLTIAAEALCPECARRRLAWRGVLPETTDRDNVEH